MKRFSLFCNVSPFSWHFFVASLSLLRHPFGIVLPQAWHSLAIGLARLCHRDGRVVPSLKKSLAHVEYFWRGLEEKKISRHNEYYSG